MIRLPEDLCPGDPAYVPLPQGPTELLTFPASSWLNFNTVLIVGMEQIVE